MATNEIAPQVTTPDGTVLIYDPAQNWKIWALFEIYQGPGSTGVYVPKLGDHVRDTGAATVMDFEVVKLDITTFIPTLKYLPPSSVEEISDTDVLLGVGPGVNSSARMYVNKSVIPYAAAIDARAFIHGVTAKYAKVFKGSITDANSKVISAVYDSGGTLLGNSVELVLAAIPNTQNFAIKYVPPFKTTEDLPNGDKVTVVIYDDANKEIYKQTLLVENTAFVPNADSATKYITNIRLESPWMSSSDPDLLAYPMNTPLDGLNAYGVVEFSDGTEKRYPCDGTRMTLAGFTNYSATVVGQKLDIVLQYRMQDSEVDYGQTVNMGRVISRAYKARTTLKVPAYTPKLYGYPVWVDDATGYRLEWFMYNLDRQQYWRVTPWVELGSNSPPFNPKSYGVTQRLSFQIMLNKVSGQFPAFKYVQTMDIVLMRKGDARETNWTIAFDPTQDPPFGRDNHADTTFVNQNLWTVNLAMGETDVTGWLNRVYYNTKPLFDADKESAAIEPDYFAIVTADGEFEFPISQWSGDLPVSYTTDSTGNSSTNSLANNGTLFVKFMKKTNTNTLQLAIAGFPIYQQGS